MARRIMDPDSYRDMSNDELDRTIAALQDIRRTAVSGSTQAEAGIYLVAARHEKSTRKRWPEDPNA